MNNSPIVYVGGVNSDPARNSTKAIIQACILSLCLLLVYCVLFLSLRHYFPRLYHPKTYLGRRYERNDPPPTTFTPFQLLKAMFNTPDHQIIGSCGLDVFFFLRYIQFLFGLFALLSILVIPIVAPINYLGGVSRDANSKSRISNSVTSNYTILQYTTPDVAAHLSSMAWGHINSEHYSWYWAHFVVAVALVVIVCYTHFTELKYFVQIRQAWLRIHNRRDKCSSGTILLTAIPQHRLYVEDLRRYFAGFHGGVDHVWINQDVRELSEKIAERTSKIKLLETLETKLVVRTNKVAQETLKSEEKPGAKTPTKDLTEGQTIQSNPTTRKTAGEPQSTCSKCEIPIAISDGSEQPSMPQRNLTNSPCESECDLTFQEHASEKWRLWLTEKDRPMIRIPHHRNWFLKYFPLFGHKEDAIVHYRREISRLNGEIEIMRKREFPNLNSAFIRFKTRLGAHLALTAPHQPASMRVIAFEPSYNDIIWSNVAPGYCSHKIYQVINIILVSSLIISYTIPTTCAAVLSQFGSFLEGKSMLSDVKTWFEQNQTVLTFVEMVCPSLLLTFSRWVIPPALGYLAHKQGAPTRAHVELMSQIGHFAFLFVQIFGVGSISSSSIYALGEAAKAEIASPDGLFDWPTFCKKFIYIVSHDLPNSTNFFIGYLLFQGISTGGDEIGQVCNGFFKIWHWLRTTLGKTRTPRQVWKHQQLVPMCSLGITFPMVTLYACIVLAFSIIQPFVLILGTLGFGLLWIGFGYSFLYVKRVMFSIDGTGGGLFKRAMNQTFAGIYVMEICLAGLFASVGRVDGDESGGQTMVQGALMSVVFFTTIGWQWFINQWLKKIGIGLYEYKGADLEEIREQPDTLSKNDYLPEVLQERFYSQRPVWIPDDLIGVGKDEARLCKMAGVMADYGSYNDSF